MWKVYFYVNCIRLVLRISNKWMAIYLSTKVKSLCLFFNFYEKEYFLFIQFTFHLHKIHSNWYPHYCFGTYFFKCKLLMGLITFCRSSRCFFKSLSCCFRYLAFLSVLNDICKLPKRPVGTESSLFVAAMRWPKLVLESNWNSQKLYRFSEWNRNSSMNHSLVSFRSKVFDFEF